MRRFALLGLGLGLAACGAAAEPLQGPDLTRLDDVTTTTEELTLQTTPSSEADLLALAEAARADLAGSLDVEVEDVAVTSAMYVTWNDGSLGCPQPGMAYTQALVDGALVTLEHAGTTYDYHQAGDQLFLCKSPAEGSYVVSEKDSGRLQMTPPPGFND